jgi:NADH-quinone oxidoreductase subunit N
VTLDLSIPAQLTLALGPDLTLIACAMVLMLGAAFLPEDARAQRTIGYGAIIACVATLGLVFFYAARATAAGPGPVAVDRFRWAVDVVVLLGTIGTLALTVDHQEREGLAVAETHVLILFSSAGMMLLGAARDLMVLFLALEIMSISVYALVGIDRRSARSAEGALKYFLLGSFSTAFLLFGIALVYGATGATALDAIAARIDAGLGHELVLLYLGIGFLVIGFGFKVSAAPFHMWAPDVYEGAPSPVTAYMSAAVKAAAFAAFLRTWMEAFPQMVFTWRLPLLSISIATMVVGCLVAIPQQNVKRMLAYSSIVHSGYILLAVVAGTAMGQAAFLFYLVSYTLATLGAFAVVGATTRPDGSHLTMREYSGLWHERPWLALAMSVYMLALLGFPFFGGTGFLAKWYMLQAALDGPFAMPGAAVALVLTSCVSAGFYLYLVTLMFMKERPVAPLLPPARPLTRLVIAATATGILGLGIFSEGLLAWADTAVRPAAAAVR